MRRRWWLASVVTLVALLATGCGGGDDTGTVEGGDPGASSAPTFPPGTSLEAIQKRGRLVAGVKFDQPLFGIKNPTTGQVEGFDVEIARIIAEGIFGSGGRNKVEFVEAVSRNREPFLQEGKVDVVIATYTINDRRKEQVDFAGPYLVARQDILVKKSDDTIKSVQDLNGKKVCSAQGSTSLSNLQAQAPQADTSTVFDRYSLCVEALADGRVEAVTTDNAILAGFVEGEPDKYKLVGAPFSNEPYGIGLKKGDQALRTFLNDRLEQSFRDGSWKRAYERTVGKVITPAPEPPALDRY